MSSKPPVEAERYWRISTALGAASVLTDAVIYARVGSRWSLAFVALTVGAMAVSTFMRWRFRRSKARAEATLARLRAEQAWGEAVADRAIEAALAARRASGRRPN